MCKVNSAPGVNRKMSSSPASSSCLSSLLGCITPPVSCSAGGRTTKELDTRPDSNIIRLTRYGPSPPDQTILSSSAEHLESALPNGSAPQFSEQSLLRSKRFTTGQVRNAPAGRRRPAISLRNSSSVRLLASVVLPGTSRLSAGRSGRLIATQTRTTIRAQAHRRADAVCEATAEGRTRDFQLSAGPAPRPALRHLGSPAQHRPSSAASKKTPVSPDPANTVWADRRLVTAYEELRRQAVEGGQRGPGLALLMARGFRCWMEGASQLLLPADNRTRPLPCGESSLPTGLRGEGAVLLVNMLLHKAYKELT